MFLEELSGKKRWRNWNWLLSAIWACSVPLLGVLCALLAVLSAYLSMLSASKSAKSASKSA